MLAKDQPASLGFGLGIVQLREGQLQNLVDERNAVNHVVDVLQYLVMNLLELCFDVVEFNSLDREVSLEAALFVVEFRLLHLRFLIVLPDPLSHFVRAVQ